VSSEGSPTRAEREARRVCEDRLHLLLCTDCKQRVIDCSCEGVTRTADKQHVTYGSWKRVSVFTAEQVRAAAKLADVDPAALLAVLEPEQRGERRSAGHRQESRPPAQRRGEAIA